MKLTAQEVYNRLVNVDKILTLKGRITFNLGSVGIIVKQRDVIGNIMQEWVQGWLEENCIEYSINENTQMPPDFYLLKDDHTKNLLEIKAFNRDRTPAFDIADFKAYQREIINEPYMLHTDYLIFGYNMSDDGVVTICDVWLKKVWEICRSSAAWPINVQYKNKIVTKIRPGVWYSSVGRYQNFDSVEDYISAIEQTVWKNPETRSESADWLQRFNASYQRNYGNSLSIPRWDLIKNKYGNE